MSDIKNTLKQANYSKPKPTLSLTEKDLPEIKNWKIGGKYTITLDVEQISASKGDEWDDRDSNKEIRARFTVLKAHSDEE